MPLQAVGIARQGGAEGLKLLLPLIQGMLPLQHFLVNAVQIAEAVCYLQDDGSEEEEEEFTGYTMFGFLCMM